MKQEHVIAVVSILLSVVLSLAGATFMSGKELQRIEHNATEIQYLKSNYKEIHEVVNNMRVELSSQNATVATKLDYIMQHMQDGGKS